MHCVHSVCVFANLSVFLLCLGHSRRAGQLILHLLQTHTGTKFKSLKTKTKAQLSADRFINEIFCSCARITSWQIKMSKKEKKSFVPSQ